MTLNNNIYPQGGLISVWWVYHHQVILNTTPCNPLNSLTSMMLCMCGRRRSRRTSSSMTRALHTFFRTSGSSSVASANRFYRGWKDHGQMSSWHSVKEQTQTVIIIIITWHVTYRVCTRRKKNAGDKANVITYHSIFSCDTRTKTSSSLAPTFY